MNPQTLTAEETAMLKLLRAHPALAEKVAEVLAVVAGGSAVSVTSVIEGKRGSSDQGK